MFATIICVLLFTHFDSHTYSPNRQIRPAGLQRQPLPQQLHLSPPEISTPASHTGPSAPKNHPFERQLPPPILQPQTRPSTIQTRPPNPKIHPSAPKACPPSIKTCQSTPNTRPSMYQARPAPSQVRGLVHQALPPTQGRTESLTLETRLSTPKLRPSTPQARPVSPQMPRGCMAGKSVKDCSVQ